MLRRRTEDFVKRGTQRLGKGGGGKKKEPRREKKYGRYYDHKVRNHRKRIDI